MSTTNEQQTKTDRDVHEGMFAESSVQTVNADSQDNRHSVDMAVIVAAMREILIAIGENPDREGLRDTPARVARWWNEFIGYDAGRIDTTFEVVQVDQMVVVSGIKIWSLCEHHLLPFWSDISVAYLTENKVLGLSKLARIAQKHAHKLQIQERLTTAIADEVSQITGTNSVAVVAQGQHLCMTMRGVKTPAIMTTSDMRGRFREDFNTRMEFISLAGLKQRSV